MAHRRTMLGLGWTTLLAASSAVGVGSPALAAAPSGQLAPLGATLIADQEQREVQLTGGVALRLDPGTRCKRMPSTSLVLSSLGKTTPTHVFLLEQGRIEVEVAQPARNGQMTHGVMIRSINNEVAVIKQGRAMVLQRGSALITANQSGETLVGTSQRVRPLAQGTIRDPSGGAARNATVAMLGAPALRIGPRVGLWIADQVVPVALQWEPVQGARAWSVELRDLASSRMVRRLRVEERAASIGDSALPAGSYVVTVRAIDEYGLEGEASAPERVTFSSALIPAGGYVDDRGRIRVAKGQTVAFSRAGEIEVSRGEPFQWNKASTSIGLESGAPTKWFVRQAGSSIGTPVELAPRVIRAQVRMGPGSAVWPRDTVSITIRLSDDAGQAPSWVQPIPRVTIGLRPVSVAWERHGDELRAVVPPQGGSGPWVVRVDVRDQYDIPLGSGFLEVDRRR
ncbi:MAG: hypothetical protein HY898_14155 [Deltaproteobacteria bacterium]|nr:hypothetical protein [Deltaproteobacteria bacterium]